VRAAPQGSRSGRASVVATVVVLIGGMLSGSVVWLLADRLSRSDVGGIGWSLRGNGALIVPFVFGPALLGAGWAALLLWHRGIPSWVGGAALAGAAALGFAFLGSFVPILLLGGDVAAPAFLPPVLLNVLPLIVFVASIFVPIVVAALLSRHGRLRVAATSLALGIVVLPVALVGGFLGTQMAVVARAGDIAGPRAGHEATLLSNGDVLVVGGFSAYGLVSVTQAFTPATGAWRTTGKLRSGPFIFELAPLPGGALAVSSPDQDGQSWAATFEVGRDTWTEIPSVGRIDGPPRAAPSDDGAVLVAATGPGPDGAVAPRWWRFDAASRSFAPAPSTGAAQVNRLVGTVTLGDGRVLVMGMSGPGQLVAAIYNPRDGAWAGAAAPSIRFAPRSSTMLRLADGRVFVGGGGPATEGSAIYDPATDRWSAVPRMGSPRGDFAATLLADGRLLVAGGNVMPEQGPRVEISAAAEIYDPSANRWSPTGPMNVPRAAHTLTLLGDGRVLAAGGADRSGPLASAEIYDPTTGSWTRTGSMDNG